MLTVLAVLGWVILAFVVMLVLIAFSQMHIRIILRSNERAQLMFELRLFSARLPSILRIAKILSAQESKPVTPAPEAIITRNRANGFRIRSALSRRFTAHLRDVPTVVVDTLSGIHLDRISLRAQVGLTDPADTGRLYGLLCPFKYAIVSDRLDVDMTPDFAKAGFEGNAELSLHFVPARLAWPTIRFASRVIMAPS